MLIYPDSIWPRVLNEKNSEKKLYRNYLFPITGIVSLLILLIELFYCGFWQALGLALINLIAMLGGNWLAFLLTREYLCRQFSFETHLALNLTVYSGGIFILFHSIGNAFGNAFLGQLFSLASFIFIRTLYKGLHQIPGLQPKQKTNVMVICSLSIICMPVIIHQLRMILFGISVFNI